MLTASDSRVSFMQLRGEIIVFVTQDVCGPSIEELRPLRSDPQPLYKELEETLIGPVKDDRTAEVIRHVMATCSAYAYSDARTMAITMSRLGLVENRCRMISLFIDGGLIASTAHVIQSNDGRVVIVCYRGTQPTNIINWLASGDVIPEAVRLARPDEASPDDQSPRVNVHRGFYRNVRATRFEVVAALGRAVQGGSVHAPSSGQQPEHEYGDHPPDPPVVYVIGHSLGGAMAVLMSLMLLADKDREPIGKCIRAVYTFGQPMIGDSSFTDFCDKHLKGKLFRHIYGRDIVPYLPPLAAGAYQHGKDKNSEYRYELDGLPALQNAAGDASSVDSRRLPEENGPLVPSTSPVHNLFKAIADAASDAANATSEFTEGAVDSAENIVRAVGGFSEKAVRALTDPRGAYRDIVRGGEVLHPDSRRGRWVPHEKPVGQAEDPFAVALATASFLTEKIVVLRSLPWTYELEDHLPEHYVSASRPEGVDSEFGDD